VSSVTTHLVLTTRKALSLCFTVWYVSRGWSVGVGVGAAMVFVGSALFGLVAKDGAGDETDGQAKDRDQDNDEGSDGNVRKDVRRANGQLHSKQKFE
jgi:hypothetical protein